MVNKCYLLTAMIFKYILTADKAKHGEVFKTEGESLPIIHTPSTLQFHDQGLSRLLSINIPREVKYFTKNIAL